MTLNGFVCLGLAYSGCDDNMAVLLLTLSLALHGVISKLSLSSVDNIATEHKATITGFINTMAVIPAGVSPIIVGLITFENQTVAAWKRVFEISAGILLMSGTLTIWFMDTTGDAWNKASVTDNEQAENEPFCELDRRLSDRNNEAFPLSQNAKRLSTSSIHSQQRSFRKSKELIPFSRNSQRLSQNSRRRISEIAMPIKPPQIKAPVDNSEMITQGRERAMSLGYC